MSAVVAIEILRRARDGTLVVTLPSWREVAAFLAVNLMLYVMLRILARRLGGDP